MPSVGIPSNFQPASPIWNVSGKGQWLALGDQAALYGFSVGDIFLIAGLLLFVVWKVFGQLRHGRTARIVKGLTDGNLVPHQR